MATNKRTPKGKQEPRAKRKYTRKPKEEILVSNVTDLFSDKSFTDELSKILGSSVYPFIRTGQKIIMSPEFFNCDRNSLKNAFLNVASLGLMLEPKFGHVSIGTYFVDQGRAKSKFATFNIDYRGLIQLSIESELFTNVNATNVKQGELVGIDRLSGKHSFSWVQNDVERNKLETVGFVAFIEMRNGFSKELYFSKEKIVEHAKKYSKTFSEKESFWSKDFEGMASKTVLKLILDKYAPKSIQKLSKAISFDQSIIEDFERGIVNYADNPNQKKAVDLEKMNEEEERNRMILHIQNSKTLAQLNQCEGFIPDQEVKALFDEKKKSLKK